MGNISGQRRKARGKLMDSAFINSPRQKLLREKIDSGELAPEDDATVFREIKITFSRPPRTARLDAHLASRFGNLSRTFFQRLIRDGEVLVNARPSKPGYRLRLADVVTLRLPEMPERIIAPEPIPLDVIHEDSDILVINKPVGIICHPGRGNQKGTLANAVINRLLGGRPNEQNTNPGIVHRLDKNTTGVMVVAKNPYAHLHLSRQFMSRRVEKTYLALVEGKPPARGTIELPIGFHPRVRELMTCAPDGIEMKEARSDYEVVEEFSGCSLLAVRLHTGRTHQIRVHFQAIGHPIVGDAAYAGHGQTQTIPTKTVGTPSRHTASERRTDGHGRTNTKRKAQNFDTSIPRHIDTRCPAAAGSARSQARSDSSLQENLPMQTGGPHHLPAEALRQALHAWKLTITHPGTGRRRTFVAPLAGDFEEMLAALRSHK